MSRDSTEITHLASGAVFFTILICVLTVYAVKARKRRLLIENAEAYHPLIEQPTEISINCWQLKSLHFIKRKNSKVLYTGTWKSKNSDIPVRLFKKEFTYGSLESSEALSKYDQLIIRVSNFKFLTKIFGICQVPMEEFVEFFVIYENPVAWNKLRSHLSIPQDQKASVALSLFSILQTLLNSSLTKFALIPEYILLNDSFEVKLDTYQCFPCSLHDENLRFISPFAPQDLC